MCIRDSLRVDQLLDDGLDLVQGVRRRELPDHVEHRGHGPLAISEEADQRDQRQQRGEERQHGVVGERGGLVRALVLGCLLYTSRCV